MSMSLLLMGTVLRSAMKEDDTPHFVSGSVVAIENTILLTIYDKSNIPHSQSDSIAEW